MKHRVKNYRVFEGLRIAACLTFISGYINAFTFVTQNGIFAGVQSGNVIMWAYHSAQGNWQKVLNFTIPIIFFMLGQCVTYLVRRWFVRKNIFWHFGASVIMQIIIVITVLLTPILPSFFTMANLALVASIQVESFRKLRGAPYANVMMTGNVKNGAFLLFKGLIEKNTELQKAGRNIFLIIFTFALGVALSTFISNYLGEYGLGFVILPLFYINLSLWNEKNWKEQEMKKSLRQK
ncbi:MULTISPECIES: YoaK family protein [Streptococcus]|uniref:YoaK family protein n=1 Tax=Streptococcus caledonicus TaxID=2614158 RepID=A0ABW0UGW2_9STRE|nr:YoaK family protein [Streptococcus sp. S784/96/1]